MNPGGYRTADEILEESLDLEAAEVPSFLDSACGTNAELRAEVERLLNVHGRIGSSGFMGGAASSWVVPRLEPGYTIGRYQIESQMSAGGMSVVYRARDTGIGRFVAIKVLLPTGSEGEGANQQFLAEVRTLGSIQHAHVVQIFDFGELHGLPYIVMECLEGEDLAKAIANGRCGDFNSKRNVAIQLAEALDHVHRSGIIHRDLKPANIFLERSGTVKLMDFGIARPDQRGKTHTTALVGTPEYLPPERVKGESATQRSDIYSYGIVLFELFTGRKPYTGNTAELLYHIVHDDVPIKALRRSELPKPLIELILATTRKDPLERPATFHQVLEQLTSIRAGDATPVPSKSMLGRYLKPAVGASVLAVPLFWWITNQKPVTTRQPAAVAQVAPARPETLSPAPKLPGNIPSQQVVQSPKNTQVLAPAEPATARPPEQRKFMPPTESTEVAERGAPGAASAVEELLPSPAPIRLDISSNIKPDGAHSPLGALEKPISIPPPVASEHNQKPARSSSPVPSGTAAAPDNSTVRAQFEQDVRNVLKRYVDAYSSKDVMAVSGLFREMSDAERKKLAAAFAVAKKVELQLTPVGELQFDFGKDANRPVVLVRCKRLLRMMPYAGKAPDPKQDYCMIRLERTAQSWQIVRQD